jgi:molybdate transport system ATP-binding protein
MPVLDFNCRFHYPTGFALDFEFTADEGVTALVGPSGAGKTTVLNLIAGLLRPNDGRIKLRGQPLCDVTSGVNLPPERRGIGYVFQDLQLFPHLSAEHNLRYGQKRNHRRDGRISFDQLVDVLELKEFLSRPPATLSGGQKQRVALGRAILRNPQMLLLDEPLSALHVELRDNVIDYLTRAVREFRIPMLLVSHDQPSIARLADAIVQLNAPVQ